MTEPEKFIYNSEEGAVHPLTVRYIQQLYAQICQPTYLFNPKRFYKRVPILNHQDNFGIFYHNLHSSEVKYFHFISDFGTLQMLLPMNKLVGQEVYTGPIYSNINSYELYCIRTGYQNPIYRNKIACAYGDYGVKEENVKDFEKTFLPIPTLDEYFAYVTKENFQAYCYCCELQGPLLFQCIWVEEEFLHTRKWMRQIGDILLMKLHCYDATRLRVTLYMYFLYHLHFLSGKTLVGNRYDVLNNRFSRAVGIATMNLKTFSGSYLENNFDREQKEEMKVMLCYRNHKAMFHFLNLIQNCYSFQVNQRQSKEFEPCYHHARLPIVSLLLSGCESFRLLVDSDHFASFATTSFIAGDVASGCFQLPVLDFTNDSFIFILKDRITNFKIPSSLSSFVKNQDYIYFIKTLRDYIKLSNTQASYLRSRKSMEVFFEETRILKYYFECLKIWYETNGEFINPMLFAYHRKNKEELEFYLHRLCEKDPHYTLGPYFWLYQDFDIQKDEESSSNPAESTICSEYTSIEHPDSDSKGEDTAFWEEVLDALGFDESLVE